MVPNAFVDSFLPLSEKSVGLKGLMSVDRTFLARDPAAENALSATCLIMMQASNKV